MPLLEQIKSPADVRKLSADQLAELAGEMRTVIFDSVSKNGGHLASNLGVVELTVALHHLCSVGHAGTAISTAVGMSRGDGMLGKRSQVVAVVGDASIVNGLAFEGL